MFLETVRCQLLFRKGSCFKEGSRGSSEGERLLGTVKVSALILKDNRSRGSSEGQRLLGTVRYQLLYYKRIIVLVEGRLSLQKGF